MKTTTRPFSRLSKADQRRAICRDALAQLRAKKLVASRGTFLQFDYAGDAKPDTSLRNLIARRTRPCSVCALGSLLVAQINLNGDCKLGEQMSDTDWGCAVIWPFPKEQPEGKSGLFSPFMQRYFDVAQLQLIEIAFERGSGAFVVSNGFGDFDTDRYAAVCRESDLAITAEQAQAAITFGKRHAESLDRLRAILKKIIRSKEAVFTP